MHNMLVDHPSGLTSCRTGPCFADVKIKSPLPTEPLCHWRELIRHSDISTLSSSVLLQTGNGIEAGNEIGDFFFQNPPRCMTTITTTKNVCGAIRADSIWPDRTRSGRDGSKTTSSVIFILLTWLLWSALTSCSNSDHLSRRVWAALWHAGSPQLRSYFLCPRRHVPVSRVCFFVKSDIG